jgi:hypothetical protein
MQIETVGEDFTFGSALAPKLATACAESGDGSHSGQCVTSHTFVPHGVPYITLVDPDVKQVRPPPAF